MRVRGHETFNLRKGWLHKGVRKILDDNRLFTRKDINPCDKLGIGANMVLALRYWLYATKIMIDGHNEQNQKIQTLTPLGEIINLYDPYYEEQGTNYLIHYCLSSNKEDATAWYWLFNIYKSSTINKEQFMEEFAEYLKLNFNGAKVAEKSLEEEFSCIIRTYYSKIDKDDDPEETKVCPLSELKLIAPYDRKNKEYKKNTPDKDDIHPLIAYSIISDNLKGKIEVRIDDICYNECNIGRIFNLDRITVIYLLEKLVKLGYITMSRTAGLDIITIIQSMTLLQALELYYQEINGEA